MRLKSDSRKEMAMIGLSVSFCIREIAGGKVPIDRVEKIIGGTRVRGEEGLKELIRVYRQWHWRELADEAEKIFRQLLAEGKIHQPRLENDRHYPNIGSGNFWVESEDEIVWQDELEKNLNQ